jgi:hypothetical protein
VSYLMRLGITPVSGITATPASVGLSRSTLEREPCQELVVRLDRRAGALGIVRHRSRAPKKNLPRASPWTQDVKR